MLGHQEKRFLRSQIELAKRYGQRFGLYRPNYSAVDNSLVFVQNIKLKAEKTGPRLTQGEVARAEYYAVFGNYLKLQKGDVLVPIESHTTTPKLTIISYSRFEETVAVRLNRTGAIYRDLQDPPVYTNVLFDWIADSGFPGSTLAENIAGSLAIPTRKMITYTRDNIRPEMYLNGEVQGMYFVETDGNGTVTWDIKLVENIGNTTQFIVQRYR